MEQQSSYFYGLAVDIIYKIILNTNYFRFALDIV